MIRIENLNKKYGNITIFENMTFSFPNKGMVCVLGPSGCGKSTLLNLLAGFDSDYEGEISVHGSLLSQMNAEELCAYRRDNIGFIFQNYHLLSGYTTLENVTLVPGAMREEAMNLLEKVGLSQKAEQKAETLSGGQKQRAAIARALVKEPSILFCDEPTGALDRKNSDEIMRLLKTLSEEHLVIVITHDKKCAEYAEQIVTIQNGKLICEYAAIDDEKTIVLKKRKKPKVSLWERALKNFKVHFIRYVAVALAISMGVLCFALSLSSGNIMQQSISDFEAKNTAYHSGYMKVDDNEEELLSLLSNDSRIENVYGQYVLENVSVKVGEQIVDMAEKYPSAKAVQQMSYGVMPRRGENEIAISPSMAAKFDKNIKYLIGKTAEVSYDGQSYKLTVSGIFNAVYDDYFVSSDIEQKMMDGLSGNAYSVSYDVIQFEDIVVVSNDLKEQNINSQNASKEVETFLNTFRNLKHLFLAVSVLILAIGILISVILLVKQQNTRYREVGLLSALGYTKGSIRKILLYENMGLAVLSVVSTGVLTILAFGIGNMMGFPVVFSAWQIAGTIGITAILILFISLISSIRLVNTEPADALRK